MNRKVLAFITLIVFCLGISSVSAFGLPNIGGSNANSGTSTNVSGLTSSAKRIVDKYTLSSMAYLQAHAILQEAAGLKKESSATLALREKLSESPSSLAYHQQVNTLLTDNKAQAILTENLNATDLTDEKVKEIMSQSAVLTEAAGIVNASILLDVVPLVTDLTQGVSGLSKDPINNSGAIKQLKSFIDLLQFMNKAIPAQKAVQNNYKKTYEALSQKYKVDAPSAEVIQDAANKMNTKE